MTPHLVANLNLILDACPDPRIVFNTAWNIHPRDDMRRFLETAGFRYGDCLVGRTAGCGGGGGLARQWLRENREEGTPYLIVDDSTHELEASWSRIAVCQSAEGVTQDVVDQALRIIFRQITAEGERAAACQALLREAQRTWGKSWLKAEQKAELTRQSMDEMGRLLSYEDFLGEACLAPKGT